MVDPMPDATVETMVSQVLSPDNNSDPFYKILVWAILRGFVTTPVRVAPDVMPG